MVETMNNSQLQTAGTIQISSELERLYNGRYYDSLRDYLLRIYSGAINRNSDNQLPIGVDLRDVLNRNKRILLPTWLVKIRPTAKCSICGKQATAIALHDRGRYFEMAGNVGENFSCGGSKCRAKLKYEASYGHGNAVLRTAGFDIINLRTIAQTRISFSLAWKIICLAFEIPEEHWEVSPLQKRTAPRNYFQQTHSTQFFMTYL